MASAKNILKRAPSQVIGAVDQIKTFCSQRNATLFLFGSQARPNPKTYADWDFGVYFNQALYEQDLSVLKFDLPDRAFPYCIDLINLNRAPEDFIQNIAEDALLIAGQKPEKLFHP